MADVFDVLGRDHTEVKQMLAELQSPPGPGAPSGSDALALRKKMVEQLIIAESGHEAAEEQYFWPAVREHLPDGDRLADQAIEQEQAAKHTLNDLIGLDPGDSRFEELLAGFLTDGPAHIAFEETQVWPGLRAALTPEQARDLGEKLAEAKKTAPTRPHPHTPAGPGVQKTAGPVAAAADKVRDKLTGRDKD